MNCIKIIISLTICILLLPIPIWGAHHQWSQRFGDTNSQYAVDVAVDSDSSVVVVGHFCGTVDFGGGPLTSAGAEDVFLARFTHDGIHLWSKSFGDGGSQYASAVSCCGNILIAGYFNGTINFGDSLMACSGIYDSYVARFDYNGNIIESQRFTSGDSLIITDIDRDYITGYFTGITNFGSGFLTNFGSCNVFVAHTNFGGVGGWGKQFGDSSSQYGNCIKLYDNYDFLIAGGFEGSINFGGGSLTSAGSQDIFVARFASTGDHLWSMNYGDVQTQYATAIVLAKNLEQIPEYDAIVIGDFEGSVNFGGGTLTSAGNKDIFIAQFSEDNLHKWSKRYGDAAAQHATGIATNATGHLYFTGNFEGNIDFGGGILTSAGGFDIFTAKILHDGNTHVWSHRYGDSNDQWSASLAVIPCYISYHEFHNPVIVGHFFGSVDFGGGTLWSSGTEDIFIAKFFLNLTDASELPICNSHIIGTYPNPFNPSTTITCNIPAAGIWHLRIYNIDGKLVKTLHSSRMTPGVFTTTWKGRNQEGLNVQSGIYILSLESDKIVDAKKIALIR